MNSRAVPSYRTAMDLTDKQWAVLEPIFGHGGDRMAEASRGRPPAA